MQNPELSVLLSVYNSSKHLTQCLDSILNQTFSDFELLVTDDASTDDSLPILETYAHKDARIRITKNPENRGLTPSLISASMAAKGTFLARHDADDLSVPDRFRKQIEFMRAAPAVGVLGCSYHLIDENGEPLGTRQLKYFRHNIRNVLKKRNVFAHGSLMLRTDAYRQTGGYRPEFTLAQDYDLLLRLSTAWQIDFLDEPLYHLRLSKNSLSASKTALQDYYAQLAQKCHDHRGRHRDDATLLDEHNAPDTKSEIFLSRLGERHLLNQAVHLSQWGRMADARGVLLSMRTSNRTFRWVLLFISTFLPSRLLGVLYSLKWRMETVF